VGGRVPRDDREVDRHPAVAVVVHLIERLNVVGQGVRAGGPRVRTGQGRDGRRRRREDAARVNLVRQRRASLGRRGAETPAGGRQRRRRRR
jgi:hypothetical protein